METTNKQNQKQPMKYWLVEITPTGGDMLQFYIPAINQFEAYKKAEEYAEIVENENLRRFYGEFKRFP